MDADALRDRIRDALAGHQIGSGYYATAVTVAEADEMAQEVIDELGLAVAYAPAWDGEPSMSGEPHRMSIGGDHHDREGMENVVKAWAGRGDKPNARIESRIVGRWEEDDGR